MANTDTQHPGAPKPSLFAAANTAEGFRSRFDTLFSPDSGEWNSLYILKGGPGTGKSGFMKACAEAAEKHGYRVEYFFCSSDPSSLDGVRIPEIGAAILDGTAPHCVDPQHPGAAEVILNLGQFLRTEQLHAQLPAIRALQEANAAAHRLASRYLRACGELREGQKRLASPAYLETKAKKAAYRLLRGQKAVRTSASDPAVLSGQYRVPLFETAISTRGIVHLPTAEQTAEKRFYISDQRHLAAFFLSTLADAAEEKGLSAVRLGCPLCPEEPEGLYLPDSRTVFYTDRFGVQSPEDPVLRIDRFFDRERLAETREKFRFAEKCTVSLTEGACGALAEAGKLHDELESYYIAAMDFPAKEAFQRRFLRALFAGAKAT